jgi:adenosylcobinamide-GDP ribazoletransferase
LKSLICALSFLTPLPISTEKLDNTEFARSQVWFSFIGIFQGLVISAAFYGLSLILTKLAASVFAVAVWAMVTGGMHLDGLGDCFDGFFAVATRERRLEIMKDPRLGTFGTLGLVIAILTKVALVSTISISNLWSLVPLVLAPVFARGCSMLLSFFGNARGNGLGFGLNSSSIWLYPLINFVPAIILAIYCGWIGTIALLASVLATLFSGLLALSKIGGVTGDVFGMAIELSEIAVLFVFAIHF